MTYYRKLIGAKCYLSPIDYNDLDQYTNWVNDYEIGHFTLFSSDVITQSKELELLNNIIKKDVLLAIVKKETNKAIGICGLHNKDDVHRSALLGIFIGDENNRNHGIGSEAIKLLLDFGFNSLNLHSISLEVMDYNKRAIHCYENCGFVFAGKKREAIYIAGKYHDINIYDILQDDFDSPFIKDQFCVSTNNNIYEKH